MQAIERVSTHPGEMLREEFMRPLNISAEALAAAIKVPVGLVTDIAGERSGITSDTAARLSRFFGTSGRFWLNLQSEYDLSVTCRERAAELASIVPYAGEGPNQDALTSRP